jgi:toxin secretion/phage lysis holin
MGQMLHLARQEWIAALPYFIILLVSMVLDVVMGLLIAFSSKQLSSSASWRGITRKIGVLILIAFASALDPLVPIPLTMFAAIGYIIPEGLSLMENGAKLGITKNRAIIDALARLRQNNDTTGAAKVQIVAPVEVTPVEHKEEGAETNGNH